ncbi:hypothetical protein AALO_G00262500 [Alosa alosa]|uniref:ADNP zinc finger domain-containing protein n=1 Tax=Alosa alosa TaxID=278164 RepID=A0AAV6FTX2_9TELE|nr:hypothetical protein AALO_G00262500 [Alosa alosa]
MKFQRFTTAAYIQSYEKAGAPCKTRVKVQEMYQVPVLGLDKIRRSRKNVKSILSEFGLEQCEVFSQELEEDDPVETAFSNTEWSDLTVGFHGRRRKKWSYRTQALCCSLYQHPCSSIVQQPAASDRWTSVWCSFKGLVQQQ